MAHSHERTLLASLGFSDRDRRERRHTWACQYLCEPAVAVRVAEHLKLGTVADAPKREAVTVRKGEICELSEAVHSLRFRSAETEVMITRGRDHVVGFWDVAVTFSARHDGWQEECDVHAEVEEVQVIDHAARTFGGTWSLVTGRPPAPRVHKKQVVIGTRYKPVTYPTSPGMFVEVKAMPVDVADIAKQMALYKEFTRDRDDRLLVVATCYAMPRSDRETLAAKGVRHIWLGDGFDAYCETRRAEGLDVAGGGL